MGKHRLCNQLVHVGLYLDCPALLATTLSVCSYHTLYTLIDTHASRLFELFGVDMVQQQD